MSQQRHVIKEQVLDLRVSTQLSTFELQNQVSKIYRSQIVPLVEACCDRLSDPDTLYRLNSLTLDLGEVSLASLEKDMVEKIATQLPQQLAKELRTGAIASPAPSATPSPTQPAKEPAREPARKPAAATRSAAEPEGAISRLQNHSQSKKSPSTLASQLELMSYFLETGLLPWWCEPLSAQSLDTCCQQLQQSSPSALKQLLLAQLKHTTRLERIIYQFSDPTLVKLITLVVPDWTSWLSDYHQTFQALSPQLNRLKTISTRQMRLTFWQGLWCQISLKPQSLASPESVIHDHLLHISNSFQIETRSLFTQINSLLSQGSTANAQRSSPLQAALTHTLSHPQSSLSEDTTRSTAAIANRLRPAVKKLLDLLHPVLQRQDIPSRLKAEAEETMRSLTALITDIAHPEWLTLSTSDRLNQISALATAIDTESSPARQRKSDFSSLSQSVQTTIKTIRLHRLLTCRLKKTHPYPSQYSR